MAGRVLRASVSSRRRRPLPHSPSPDSRSAGGTYPRPAPVPARPPSSSVPIPVADETTDAPTSRAPVSGVGPGDAAWGAPGTVPLASRLAQAEGAKEEEEEEEEEESPSVIHAGASEE